MGSGCGVLVIVLPPDLWSPEFRFRHLSGARDTVRRTFWKQENLKPRSCSCGIARIPKSRTLVAVSPKALAAQASGALYVKLPWKVLILQRYRFTNACGCPYQGAS